MGFFDSLLSGDLSGAAKSAGNFITANKNWLQPAAAVGIGLYNQGQKSNAESQYVDYLKQREDQNYQNSLANYQQGLLEQAAGAANAKSKSAAAAANANARAAAARATEANRQAALKKGEDQSQKTYKQLIQMYAPLTKSAMQLLPIHQQVYQGGVDQLNMLQAYLNSPQQLQKLNPSQPSYNINVPLPPGVG